MMRNIFLRLLFFAASIKTGLAFPHPRSGRNILARGFVEISGNPELMSVASSTGFTAPNRAATPTSSSPSPSSDNNAFYTASSSRSITSLIPHGPQNSTSLNNNPASASRVLASLASAFGNTATTSRNSASDLLEDNAAVLSQGSRSHLTQTYFTSTLATATPSQPQMSSSRATSYNELLQEADIQPSSTTVNPAGSTDTLDSFLYVLQAIGRDEPASTNALSVLVGALPSNVASSVLGLDSSTSQSAQATDSTTTGSTPITTQSSGLATATSSQSDVTTSSQPTTTSAPITTSTTPSTLSTITQRPSSATSVSAAAAPSTAVPTSSSTPVRGAAIAGIVTGVAAGVVLIGLGAAFLWHRKKKGLAPFSKDRGSQRSGRVYPEVAWLYDPSPSPQRGDSPPGGEGAARPSAALLPRPSMQEQEMAELSGDESPHMPPERDSSPLLLPHLLPPRDESPARSSRGNSPSGLLRVGSHENIRRSVQSSTSDVRRPLTAIFEESRGQ